MRKGWLLNGPQSGAAVGAVYLIHLLSVTHRDGDKRIAVGIRVIAITGRRQEKATNDTVRLSIFVKCFLSSGAEVFMFFA